MIRFKKDDGSNYPDWEEKPINETHTIFKGAALSKADISENGTPFILYGELYTTYNEITYEIARKTEKEVDKKYHSQIGDVVIPTSGETPEEISTATCVMKDGVILAGDLNIYRSKYVDGRFFSYLMNHNKKYEVAKIAQGASVIHIQASEVGKISIPIPCLEEQQKIADFLSSVDNVIAVSEQEIATLEEQKKGIMQKIFSQEVRFKADDGTDYPEWEEKNLDSLFEYKNGNSFENVLDENGQYFLISLNSIDRKGNLQKELKRVNEAEWFLEKNDIVMVLSDVGKGNFLGLCDIIPCNNVYVLNQRMGLLRAKEDLNYIFMRNYINHNQKYFKSQGQGSAQLNISKGDVLKFQVKCPCLEEQQKIADFLSDFDTAIDLAKQELEQWKELKKGLLQQLFE